MKAKLAIGDRIYFTNNQGDGEWGKVTNIQDAVLSTYYFVGNRRIARDPRDSSLFEMD